MLLLLLTLKIALKLLGCFVFKKHRFIQFSNNPLKLGTVITLTWEAKNWGSVRLRDMPEGYSGRNSGTEATTSFYSRRGLGRMPPSPGSGISQRICQQVALYSSKEQFQQTSAWTECKPRESREWAWEIISGGALQGGVGISGGQAGRGQAKPGVFHLHPYWPPRMLTQTAWSSWGPFWWVGEGGAWTTWGRTKEG